MGENQQHYQGLDQAMDADHAIREFLADQCIERAFEGDVVIGKKPGRHQQGQRAEQRQHREGTEGVVALALPPPLQVILDSARPTHELAETGVGRPGNSPNQAKHKETDHCDPDAAMPDHGIAADVHRDEGGEHTKRQGPVEDPGRKVPKAEALHQTTASCFSTLTWMNCSRDTPIHMTRGLATSTDE